MSYNNSKYFFGRLNVIAMYKDKFEFIEKGLDIKVSHIRNNFIYCFLDVNHFENKKGKFFHGFLVKYKPSETAETVNEKLHTFDKDVIEDLVIAKSRFFLHLESGLITFNPKGNYITIPTFMNIFKILFEKSHNHFFTSVDIQLIEDRVEMLESLRKFERIDKVSVKLHPSNPSNSKIWQRTDDRLKSLGAISYKEEIEAKKDGVGLKVIGDEEVISKITMAEDGYGKASATGLIDGEIKTISTYDKPVCTEVPNNAKDQDKIFKLLLVTLNKIFSRFTKKKVTRKLKNKN